jgi:hypothetical protein
MERRIKRLERERDHPGLDPETVGLWASLWAGARVWQEAGDRENVQALEEDRVAARGFFAYCRSAGEKPTFAALNKWAHNETHS